MDATATATVEADLARAEVTRVHKEKFYQALDLEKAQKLEKDLTSTLSKNSNRNKTRTEYEQLIKEIEDAYSKVETKTSHEKHLIKQFQIVNVGETKKIVKKQNDKTENVRYCCV